MQITPYATWAYAREAADHFPRAQVTVHPDRPEYYAVFTPIGYVMYDETEEE